MLTLILGGARSGKSRFAQRLAAHAQRVCYIATLLPCDDAEMHARVARHQSDRPASWHTLEAPLLLADAVAQAARDADTVLVDCLTLWLSNLSWELRDTEAAQVEEGVRAEIQRLAAAARSSNVILVSNEVGAGVVPESPVARAFRDLQGFANQWTAEVSDTVVLVVAGLPLYLKGGIAR